MGVDESWLKAYYVDEIAMGGQKVLELLQEELIV